MLTLVIPTKNRSAFLDRALRYYAAVSCQFPILIGDSSDPEHLTKTQRTLRSLSSQLQVHHMTGVPPATSQAAGWQQDATLQDLIQHVQTPYVAFVADDDFAVVNHLQAATHFLEAHPEYSFVSGKMALFFLTSGITHGEIQAVEPYAQQTILDDDPARRLTAFLSHYTVLEYGVSRTHQKRARWQQIMSSQADNLIGELMNGCLSVLQGKIKQLDHLLVVRQAHSQQTSARVQDAFDWVSHPSFSNHWSRLLSILTQELVSRTGWEAPEARKVVTNALWSYLYQVVTKEWAGRYGRRPAPWRESIRQRPTVRMMWYTLRAAIPGMEPEMSLPALLRRSSPYHADFEPIYHTVTRSALSESESLPDPVVVS